MKLINNLNILLKITVITFITTFLKNENLKSNDIYYNIISTSLGFIIANYVNNKLQKKIKEINNKIGYNILEDISTPIIIFLVKILLERENMSLKKFLPTLYTIIGFTTYNILVKEKIFKLDNFSEDLKKLTENIFKPLVMLSVNNTLSGKNILEVDNIRNILYIVISFVSHFLLSKYFKL